MRSIVLVNRAQNGMPGKLLASAWDEVLYHMLVVAGRTGAHPSYPFNTNFIHSAYVLENKEHSPWFVSHAKQFIQEAPHFACLLYFVDF